MTFGYAFAIGLAIVWSVCLVYYLWHMLRCPLCLGKQGPTKGNTK